MKGLAHHTPMLLGIAVVVSFFTTSALSAAEQGGAIRVREDSFDWRITRAQITWQLDQKVIEQLKISSEEVTQRERALRESIVQSVSAQSAVKSSFEASTHFQSTLSLNPLRLLSGNSAEARVGAELELWGKLGASVDKSTSQNNADISTSSQSSRIDVSFVRAISQPRLQFTVTLRNREPKDLHCKNLVIPIWGPENVLAQAVPVDEEGRTLAEFTVPANRADGIDQLFVAKIADTVLWDFVQNGGLSKGLDLRLERGKGQILSSVTGDDLISAVTNARRNSMNVKLQLPGGTEMTWWVERGLGGKVMVAEVLSSINELLKKKLNTDMEAFCLDNGVLVSAFGSDQLLSGWVWDLQVNGEAAAIGQDLRKLIIRDRVNLARRWYVPNEQLVAPREPMKWWRLVQAMQSMQEHQAPENVEELKAIALETGPWAVYGSYRLGRMCEDGRGLKRDFAQAVIWYRKAAEAGNPAAMVKLGGAYNFGRGVKKDEGVAARWYRRATAAGDLDGMCSFGWCFLEGWGVRRDEAEAIKWFEKAANAGNPDGINNLGVMYSQGRGVKKDDAEALKLFRKAAAAGYEPGICNVGWAYANGRGVARDLTEGVKWYRKAAEKGDAHSMINLGDSHSLRGDGVTKEDVEAFKWYQKAADEGLAEGMYKVAWAYDIGRGVKRDREEALRWYRQAAEAGHYGVAAVLMAKRIGPAFVAFASDKADESAKKAAVATVKGAMTEFKALDLKAMGEVVTDFGIATTVRKLREKGGGEMVWLYDEMRSHYLESFKETDREARWKSAVSFAACTEESTGSWFGKKQYDTLVEFWRQTCAGMPIDRCTDGNVEPLIRLMNRCVNALLKSGNRKEGEQLLAETLKLCDNVLSERPWDWFAKRAYVDLCFDTAATLSDLNDVAAAQPLLRRGFVERLRQNEWNESKWLEEHAGKNLPLDRNEVYIGGKKFTIQADCDGTMYPVEVYIRERSPGLNRPIMADLRNQFLCLELAHRVIVPREKQESFERLFLIAQENNVSYVDLCEYALRDSEKKPEPGK